MFGSVEKLLKFIKLLRSAVFMILSSDNRKVSTKLPRSDSFLDIENVSIKLLRSAVLSTQKSAHRTAKVRSFMDTLKYCHIWQESPSVKDGSPLILMAIMQSMKEG